MKLSESSWRFALATTGGMFLFATGVHALSRPGELVDYVAEGVVEILPEREGDAGVVGSLE